MVHNPYPASFPASPNVGDLYTHDNSVWLYTGTNLGWVKKVVHRSDTYPMWGGQITKTGS